LRRKVLLTFCLACEQELNVSDLVVKAQVLAGGRGKGHFSKVNYPHKQHGIVSHPYLASFHPLEV
jgi:succinyl-CoA synthetase beta subunit